jgi:NAD(P)-dependent dehydrogenase (short-subunit alcohol dehydrogenase family)
MLWRLARPKRPCMRLKYEFLAGLHPIGRMGEVDEIVDAVLDLEGATFVTGEILHVDGGQSAGH